MKKIVLSALVLVTLAACGKGGAERYVGIWQRDNMDSPSFMEISKESGNYFLIREDAVRGEMKQVLTEKDGELFASTGFGEIPFKLSDDGKALFATLYAGGSNSFRKIENEECKKK